jgi:hypothetical protein
MHSSRFCMAVPARRGHVEGRVAVEEAGWQQRTAMRPDHRQPRSRRSPPASTPSAEPLTPTTSWPPRTSDWPRPGAMMHSCSNSRPRATGQPPPQTGNEPNAPNRFSAQNEPPGVPSDAPGRTHARNSAEHPDMREPSPTGTEPISTPNGGSACGYQELSAPLAIPITAEQAGVKTVCLCNGSAGRERRF